jgi:hypothetical protein
MASTDKSAYHLADNPQLYEPARSNNFEFVATGIDELTVAGADTNIDNPATIKNGQETLRVSVLSSSVPHFKLDSIDVKRGNNTVHFAGTPTFDDHTLKLNDYMGARTKSVLMAWQALAYDVKTEKIHTASNYKKDCTLVEYSPDYSTIIRSWSMKGCWVKELTEDEYSNETNDKRTVTATICYDRAIPDDEKVSV